MGLDQYVKIRGEPIPQQVDFAMRKDDEKIHYWRKHPDLHGWMERLYRSKGGTDDSFNIVPVQLTLRDLAQLAHDVQERKLPHTEGFFFGESAPEDDSDVLEFIETARDHIAQGASVYYYGWW